MSHTLHQADFGTAIPFSAPPLTHRWARLYRCCCRRDKQRINDGRRGRSEAAITDARHGCIATIAWLLLRLSRDGR